MKDITNCEMAIVLSIFKSPEAEYNANSMAKLIGISSMGALKIAKRLEKEGILVSRELGKAKFYKLNLSSDYAGHYVRIYVRFLLKREAEQAHPYVKMWISEAKKIKSADAAILFGSVLRKHEKAKDIDILLITDQKRFSKLKKEIGEINKINSKMLHPIYQTKEDFIKNMKKDGKVVLNAIKGIIAFGEDRMIDLMQK